MDFGKSNNIAILLATYNGSKYIQDQIESLLTQSYHDIDIYVHDDDSSDDTVSLVESLAKRDQRVHILLFPSKRHSAKDNFLELLEHVDAPYYMFCDQDDVWMKDKVSISMTKMKELETKHAGKPIVICSDLIVTDRELHPVEPSYWMHAGIYPDFFTHYDRFAASSVSTGCTMLFNRSAKDAACGDASKAIMHDAWVTLSCVKNQGILYGINTPLIYYRQHGDNTVGSTITAATNFGLFYRIKHFKEMYHQNSDYYSMLRSMNYGSVLKYIYYKIIYKIWIHRHVR